MNFNDDMKLTGELWIKLFDQYGNLKDQRHIPNLVVTLGKQHTAARLANTVAAMSHMAIGSGAVAPVVGDSALGGELGRVALGSLTAAGAVATYVAAFGAGVGTGAITEAGIFSALVAGNMFSRSTFAVVNKGALDTMSITWDITVN